MSKPIVIGGQEYASVEAMPPDVRAEYEAQTAEFEQMLTEAGIDANSSEAVTPAWGGARPDGSVTVPMEFDAVTNLGPAVEVYEHEGLKLLPNFGTPRATVLVRYRDGVAYRTGGKDVHSLRWDEVAVIQSNVTYHQGSRGLGYKQHEYTLTKTGGEKLILDDGLKGVPGAAHTIKNAVFAQMGPAQTERYQSGEAMTFGPLTVQRQNGLKLDGTLYAWDTIQDVRVESGRFKVTLRNGKKHEARVSAIPNLELLCRLIGLQMDAMELAYS